MTKAIFFQRIKHVLTAGHFPKPRTAPTLATLMLGAALGGCAIHPVQQDVTDVPTNFIVRRIRCEARLAIVDKAVQMLLGAADRFESDPKIPKNAKTAKIVDKFRSIASRLVERRGLDVQFDAHDLPTPEAQIFYDRYINTVIAYDFLFNITEDNSVALAADPVRLVTNGLVGAAVGGGVTLSRNNLRNFAVSDTFKELLSNSQLKCESRDYLSDNFAYPIAGAVGLRGAIDTFINLYEDRALSKLDEKSPKVFADTLRFTTGRTLGVGPHARIDPVGFQWGVAAPTNVTFGSGRSDVHTLTIGLAMGSPGRTATRTPVGLFGINRETQRSTTSTANELNAFQAIKDLRIRNFLENSTFR